MALVANSRRSTHHALTDCTFERGGNRIVTVESFSHLCHIITSKLDDSEDILLKRSCFIGQVNNVLCYFKELNCATKIKLFKSYTVLVFLVVSYGPLMFQI